MKRLSWLTAALMLVLAAGCSEALPEDTAGSDTGTEAPAAEAPSGGSDTAPTAFDPIPPDGPGESAAVAAVPAALEEGRAMLNSSGTEMPDIAGAEPVLTAYLIIAEWDGQATLLEVHADGIAHSLYAYQQAFDAATLIWSDASNSGSPRAEPRSERETAAVAAVKDVMTDAFPDEKIVVSVYGYRFSYMRDGSSVLTLEIDTTGAVSSIGS